MVEQVGHAFDAIEFFVIENLPEDVDQFVKNLYEVVTKKFGGKTSVEIADHIQVNCGKFFI